MLDLKYPIVDRTTTNLHHTSGNIQKFYLIENYQRDTDRLVFSCKSRAGSDVKITLLITRWLSVVMMLYLLMLWCSHFLWAGNRLYSLEWALYPSQYQHAHILNINIALKLAVTEPIPRIFQQSWPNIFMQSLICQ